jgi:hypothetical protein
VGAAKTSPLDALIVPSAQLMERPNALGMQPELGAWRRAARRRAPNNQLRGDGTQRRARHGMHRSNQTGLRAKCFRNESSHARRCANIGHSIKHRSLPVVCEPDSPRLPPASETLEGTGETRQCFRECLLARLLLPVWENAWLRTTISAIFAPFDSMS